MIKSLNEYDLKYCGDSVEWCPTQGYQHILMCGSYQLETSSRVGRIELYKFSQSELTMTQALELECGLLDAKWSRNTDKPLLAAALSSGYLNIYHLVNNELQLINSIQVCTKGMALSVDWSNGVTSDNQPKLVISQSDGCISVVHMNTDGSLVVLHEFKAHDYEAWIAAFNYWETNIIYTGGDDCKLKVYDTRQELNKAIHTDTSHSVGITSVQTNHKYQQYLATASYEDVRIWKTSSMPLECIDKTEMTGGSWRVKWNTPSDCTKLAVAAMHEGFNIINYTNAETGTFGSEKIKIDYKEPHTSLGYGIDWSHSDPNLIAACSFYDKKLSIARLL